VTSGIVAVDLRQHRPSLRSAAARRRGQLGDHCDRLGATRHARGASAPARRLLARACSAPSRFATASAAGAWMLHEVVDGRAAARRAGPCRQRPRMTASTSERWPARARRAASRRVRAVSRTGGGEQVLESRCDRRSPRARTPRRWSARRTTSRKPARAASARHRRLAERGDAGAPDGRCAGRGGLDEAGTAAASPGAGQRVRRSRRRVGVAAGRARTRAGRWSPRWRRRSRRAPPGAARDRGARDR